MPYLSQFDLPQKPVGLALAGGGVRGFSQLGILKIMEKHGYEADMIAGTSIGSFVATLVAMGLKSEEIYEEFQKFEKSFTENKIFSHPEINMIKPTKNKINGMVDGDKIITIFDNFFAKYEVKNMADIQKPLVIVAAECDKCKVTYFTNVKNFIPGRDAIVIYNPPISQAIRASCSFPGVITLSEFDGYSFMDGGAMMNLPVEPLKDMGAYKVMSLTMRAQKIGFSSKSATMVLKRASDLVQYELLDLQIKQSDFNINLDVGNIKAFDVGNGTLIYKRGENIALDREDDIVKFFESVRAPEPEQKGFFAKLKAKILEKTNGR